MAVPKFYEFMPYIMACLGDGKTYNSKEIRSCCAEKIGLTEADKAELTSSGIPRYQDRISWAVTYLKKAGLITSEQRGQYRLTEAGISIFSRGDEITLDYLSSFESFREFKGKTKVSQQPSHDKTGQKTAEGEKSESPQEQMESALSELNSDLADELTAEIMKISPYEFERLVAKLLIAMGYGTMEGNPDAVTKKSGDEGIDGVVSADKFGFDSIYIQAKQWQPDSVVGRPEVQKFLGALAGQGASKGIFITTAKYSREAAEFAAKQLHSKIVLVDGKQLAKLMIEYDLGVSSVATYKIKRIDSDFFDEYI